MTDVELMAAVVTAVRRVYPNVLYLADSGVKKIAEAVLAEVRERERDG